ncbi:hypothetical protein [Priestia endophytica]|uniref:hypothetical protein n=1 Tax=Priestia endophytica TaxID=135735 RepID=UPI0022802001|nr:hypothetical protein [Priestia endophytica]MCY8232534.1 hypothetical protein [Priestia endophytica]
MILSFLFDHSLWLYGILAGIAFIGIVFLATLWFLTSNVVQRPFRPFRNELAGIQEKEHRSHHKS